LYNQRKSNAAGLQFVVDGFCDCEKALLRCVPHLKDCDNPENGNNAYVTAFRKFIIDTVLQEEIVSPMCRDVENDLRLAVHTKNLAHMSAINPKTDKAKKMRPYLEMQPLVVFDQRICLKKKVTQYLETSFYNLTTVALHDWMTYAEMRSLAKEKYGIVLADNHLPMGSLDQGLDVLQIMRNIHVFVARFNYNLNQQNFVERRPDRGAKYLNTINIQSIAASLRQHGLGILNTTVNFTYQFLAQKFHIFSQFLYDDYIHSHLAKESRWYKKNAAQLDNKFPFSHAMTFVKEIRKLGVTEGKVSEWGEGRGEARRGKARRGECVCSQLLIYPSIRSAQTFLDQFRILITEIGNALGYVRMVRSAGMSFCSEAVEFLPELNR